MNPLILPKPEDDAARMRRLTRRSFIVGGVAGAGALGAFAWLKTRTPEQGIVWPLRDVHKFNEQVGRGLFSGGKLAPEFPIALAGEPRNNGWIGYDEFQPKAKDWVITVTQPGRANKSIPLAEIQKLERVDSIIEFKCVEGWSQISHWSGFRLKDFFTKFDLLPPAGSKLKFVQLTTADGLYQSALDLPSALHPQTLLVDRFAGEPLSVGHGAPIRLIIPVKYGIKNIKWLAGIEFSEERPTDYWTQRGYDWYAGL
jgi:DMSO/TMAO reductase YedYZ molybdopterin-dependent catalytic subunit